MCHLPGGSDDKSVWLQCRRSGSTSGSEDHWRRKCQNPPVSSAFSEIPGQRLVGYSPWKKKSQTPTEFNFTSLARSEEEFSYPTNIWYRTNEGLQLEISVWSICWNEQNRFFWVVRKLLAVFVLMEFSSSSYNLKKIKRSCPEENVQVEPRRVYQGAIKSPGAMAMLTHECFEQSSLGAVACLPGRRGFQRSGHWDYS